MNRKLFMALPVALLATVVQASSEKTPARIQDLMSSQELKRCGIHKLTPSELAAELLVDPLHYQDFAAVIA